MFRELQRHVAVDGRGVERTERDLPALAARKKIQLHREQRMPCLREDRWTRRDDDEGARCIHPLHEVEDQVGR